MRLLTMSAEAWELCMRTASGPDMLRAAREEIQAQAARVDHLEAHNAELAVRYARQAFTIGQRQEECHRLQAMIDGHRAWIESEKARYQQMLHAMETGAPNAKRFSRPRLTGKRDMCGEVLAMLADLDRRTQEQGE